MGKVFPLKCLRTFLSPSVIKTDLDTLRQQKWDRDRYDREVEQIIAHHERTIDDKNAEIFQLEEARKVLNLLPPEICKQLINLLGPIGGYNRPVERAAIEALIMFKKFYEGHVRN